MVGTEVQAQRAAFFFFFVVPVDSRSTNTKAVLQRSVFKAAIGPKVQTQQILFKPAKKTHPKCLV